MPDKKIYAEYKTRVLNGLDPGQWAPINRGKEKWLTEYNQYGDFQIMALLKDDAPTGYAKCTFCQERQTGSSKIFSISDKEMCEKRKDIKKNIYTDGMSHR